MKLEKVKGEGSCVLKPGQSKINFDTMHFAEFIYFCAMLDMSRFEEPARLSDGSMKETHPTTNSS